jgi:beta-glucosidase
MKGRTYRYFAGEPLYPFGFGLSFSRFEYANLSVPKTVEAGQAVAVSVDVENAGKSAGAEVVQLYLTDIETSVPGPIRSLKGFQRIHLKPGEEKTVRFVLAPEQLSLIDANGHRVVEPGMFEVAVGGKQPGFKGSADARTTEVLTAQFEVKGQASFKKL